MFLPVCPNICVEYHVIPHREYMKLCGIVNDDGFDKLIAHLALGAGEQKMILHVVDLEKIPHLHSYHFIFNPIFYHYFVAS